MEKSQVLIMSKFILNYTDTYTDFNNKTISDFILYNCGIEYCDAGWSYGPKRRDYHFIHFVKEGKGVLKIEGHEFNIHKNQCFVVPAGEVSKYTADKKDPWKYSWIGFLGIQSSRYVQQLINDNCFVFDIKNAEKYEEWIQSIMNLPHNSLASSLKTAGVTYQIFGSLMDEVNPQEELAHISIATASKRYMELNYFDAIRIKDVADFLGVNVNYLSDCFKKELGLTPKQYLTNLKMKKSKKLLITTNSSIMVIANSVGFSDPLAFSKIFKKNTGSSPKKFRMTNQK